MCVCMYNKICGLDKLMVKTKNSNVLQEDLVYVITNISGAFLFHLNNKKDSFVKSLLPLLIIHKRKNLNRDFFQNFPQK